ncbi:MAG: DUF4956 domain-containing protein [Anaerolineales bacterium]|nr:DUF4956 domain-containing protein [Anaerolineales bacterium]
MDIFQSLQITMQTEYAGLSLFNFVINIAATIVLSLILEAAYVKLGNNSTKSRLYQNNFMLLSVTTALVITVIAVVESSVALSLGLLGVLSVVRFRAAIKDPEELAYLFLAITMGLGAGLGQILYTSFGFVVILAALAGRKFIYLQLEGEQERKLSKARIGVIGDGPFDVELDRMIAILEDYCESVKVKTLSETDEGFEVDFRVTYYEMDELMQAKDALMSLQEGLIANVRS